MLVAKKFTVIKLKEVSELGRNPYKVVPTFWIKKDNADNLTAPYPPEENLAQTFDRIFNCQVPLAEWEERNVEIEREAGKFFPTKVFTRIEIDNLLFVAGLVSNTELQLL